MITAKKKETAVITITSGKVSVKRSVKIFIWVCQVKCVNFFDFFGGLFKAADICLLICEANL